MSGESFKPKNSRARVLQLPGTRVSVNNSQLLISTGIPTLDSVLGGGVPVGSLVLLEEDEEATYSNLFLKCFLAEGVTIGHEVFLASLDQAPETLMQELPAPVIKEKDEIDCSTFDGGNDACRSSDNEGNMQIAWRYQQQKKIGAFAHSKTLGHHFDLKSTMPPDILMKSEKYCWSKSKTSNSVNSLDASSPYRNLYQILHVLLTRRKLFTTSKRAEMNIMRVAVHSLASYAWGDEPTHSLDSHAWTELTTFMALLRAVLRQSYSVALVTVPLHLFTDEALVSRISFHADCIIGLESFQGTEKEVNPLFKDYHGLLHISKLATSNSLTPPPVDTKDWVFRVKRRKLCIEKMHLPPDLSDTVSRNQADPVKSSASLCSSGFSNKFEF